MSDEPTIESDFTTEKAAALAGKFKDLLDSLIERNGIQDLRLKIKNRHIAELKAENERLRQVIRPVAECFENQEKTAALVSDFEYYSKQVARVYYRDEIMQAGQQAAQALEASIWEES